MSERRTRRQAARDAASDDTTKDTPDTDMNGHGVAKENGNDHKAKDSSPKENIFLFWPNVIGMVLSQPISAYLYSSLFELITISHRRLLSHSPSHRLSLLHAASPPNLLRPLQHFLSTRCPRRICCATL